MRQQNQVIAQDIYCDGHKHQEQAGPETPIVTRTFPVGTMLIVAMAGPRVLRSRGSRDYSSSFRCLPASSNVPGEALLPLECVVHFQLRISGRSRPYLLMYCLCSTSLSLSCCFR